VIYAGLAAPRSQNRLGQLLKDAAVHGPQLITSHGREAAFVLSPEDYHALARPKKTLTEFFRKSPFVGLKLELERLDEPAGVQSDGVITPNLWS
jgi:antitoxin Phd